MQMSKKIIVIVFLAFFLVVSCRNEEEILNQSSQLSNISHSSRSDGAIPLNISLDGSLQNPAWSPDGSEIIFTNFRKGYNQEPADLYIFTLENESLRTLVADGSGNVNLPGSAWNSTTNMIAFSSSREPHDEIFVISADGQSGNERTITQRQNLVAYEATFSPDGEWIVFESHELDVEENGIVMRYKIDGSREYEALTAASDDARQPNYSPTGDLILYQRFSNGQWDIWLMSPDGSNKRQLTSGAGDKTDASFSPDGRFIVYSSDKGELEFANLFVISVDGGTPTQITNYDGYDGAPSWSPDGEWIAFESSSGDPDEEATTLWKINISNLGAISPSLTETTFGDPREFNHSITALSFSENYYYLTWASASKAWEHDIYNQIIRVKNGEIIASTVPQRYIGSGTDEAQEPVSAAINNNGVILTVWEDGSGETVDIRGQLHYPDGRIIKANWVLAGGEDAQHSPSVSSLGENFLIAYTDETDPAEYAMIKAKIINAQGASVEDIIDLTAPEADNWWPVTASGGGLVFVGWGDGDTFQGTIISPSRDGFDQSPTQAYISNISQYYYHAAWIESLTSFLIIAKTGENSTVCLVNPNGIKAVCSPSLPPIIREANLAIKGETIAYPTGKNAIALLQITDSAIIHTKTFTTNLYWNSTGVWSRFADDTLFVATNNINSNHANYLIIGELP